MFLNIKNHLSHGRNVWKQEEVKQNVVSWGRSFLSVAWPTGVQLVFCFCSGVGRLFGAQGSQSSGSLLNL